MNEEAKGEVVEERLLNVEEDSAGMAGYQTVWQQDDGKMAWENFRKCPK